MKGRKKDADKRREKGVWEGGAEPYSADEQVVRVTVPLYPKVRPSRKEK